MNQNNPYPNLDSEPLLTQQRVPQHQHTPPPPPPPINPYVVNNQNQGES